MIPGSIVLWVVTAMQPIPANRLHAELLVDYEIKPSQVEMSDENYVLISHDWLIDDFLPYIRSYFDRNGIRILGEGLDCDNVAQIFRQQLSLSNARGGGAVRGDVPCGVVKTYQSEPFGGVNETGVYHSLLVVRTDRGWHVIEPQTGAIEKLSDYPNLQGVQWMLF